VRILALDSSTDTLSVACGDGATFAVREERAGPLHAERVLPRVREVLAECGYALGALDAIAFGAGPGAFTGVRIACGIAQGLSLGTGVPLVPVGTLEALAQEAWRAHGATRVVACLDARMREVYAASYVRDDEAWRPTHAPAVSAPAGVVADAGAFGAGDGFAVYPAIVAHLGLARHDATLRPTARAVGELAVPLVRVGATVAARDAEPMYVRHRVALTAHERAAGARM
jgi:tRNA threonylcarbamoyladenosine biosynthesis protein TsaB